MCDGPIELSEKRVGGIQKNNSGYVYGSFIPRSSPYLLFHILLEEEIAKAHMKKKDIPTILTLRQGSSIEVSPFKSRQHKNGRAAFESEESNGADIIRKAFHTSTFPFNHEIWGRSY